MQLRKVVALYLPEVAVQTVWHLGAAAAAAALRPTLVSITSAVFRLLVRVVSASGTTFLYCLYLLARVL